MIATLGSKQSGFSFKIATSPEVTDPGKSCTLHEWLDQSDNVYTYPVLCVPSEHMPLLLIIHLSWNIMLDLVVISEFIYRKLWISSILKCFILYRLAAFSMAIEIMQLLSEPLIKFENR